MEEKSENKIRKHALHSDSKITYIILLRENKCDTHTHIKCLLARCEQVHETEEDDDEDVDEITGTTKH